MNSKISPGKLEWKEGRVRNFWGKDLIVLENGSLKLVKVAPGASYPLHIHPDKTEYAYVLEGQAEFDVGQERLSGSPGEFVVFPPDTRHAIHNNTGAECILLVGAIRT